MELRVLTVRRMRNSAFHMVFFCAMVCFCVANLHLVLLYKENGSQLLPIATGIVMHGCSTSLVAIVI